MNPQLRRVLLAENPWLRGEELVAWIRHFLPPIYLPRRLQEEDLSQRSTSPLAASKG